MPAKWKMVMIQNKCHLTSCITIAHVKVQYMWKSKKFLQNKSHKKNVLCKMSETKDISFMPPWMYHIVVNTCLLVLWIMVNSGYSSEGSDRILSGLQQTIAWANVNLHKRNLSGSYNISVAILIMSKFGCFHSVNNVRSWTAGSSLVAVMTSCCNDLMSVWCQAIVNQN